MDISSYDFQALGLVYHGIDEGNPDLSTHHANASDFVGVQPDIGDSINRYHGLDQRTNNKGPGIEIPGPS